MSRFNVSVLLATALLGVLLWVVISIVAELSNPSPPPKKPPQTLQKGPDPSLPRLSNEAELADWLRGEGAEAAALITNFRDWRGARGYPSNTDLLTGYAETEDSLLSSEPDATLLVLAGRGNTAALHLLAERSITSDPVAALDWYDQAIVNGSVYAMLRVSDLLATLGDPALAQFKSDARWQQALAEINTATPPPIIRSLAWAIAAVQVGGYGVLDQRLAQRITQLNQSLNVSDKIKACETAQEYVLNTASVRRAQGGAVFSMERSQFAVSVAMPEEIVGCDVPVPPLVDMSRCERADFVASEEQLMHAWLCP